MEYIERYMHVRELIETGNNDLLGISAKFGLIIDALERLQRNIIQLMLKRLDQ